MSFSKTSTHLLTSCSWHPKEPANPHTCLTPVWQETLLSTRNMEVNWSCSLQEEVPQQKLCAQHSATAESGPQPPSARKSASTEGLHSALNTQRPPNLAPSHPLRCATAPATPPAPNTSPILAADAASCFIFATFLSSKRGRSGMCWTLCTKRACGEVRARSACSFLLLRGGPCWLLSRLVSGRCTRSRRGRMPKRNWVSRIGSPSRLTCGKRESCKA